MLNTSESLKLLVLSIINRKKIVESSYFLNQVFQNIGIFDSVEKSLLDYADEGLLEYEGYFEGNTRILKNIQITDKGILILDKSKNEETLQTMQTYYGDTPLINGLFS